MDEITDELPTAVASSTLRIGPVDLVVHVLDNGQRVIDVKSARELFDWMAAGESFSEADALKIARFVHGHG